MPFLYWVTLWGLHDDRNAFASPKHSHGKKVKNDLRVLPALLALAVCRTLVNIPSYTAYSRINSQVRRVLRRKTGDQHASIVGTASGTYLGMLTMAGVSAAA